MAIRLSGLISGMDTESIVQELMSVQSMKLTKKENLKTKTEWKLEKWKEMNTKIYSLYTGKLSKMKMQGSFQTKKVSSTNESAITATGGVSAVTGSHTVSVNSLASAQYVTGARITKDKNNNDIKSTTKLTDLTGIEKGKKITIKNEGNGSEKKFEITETTTIDDFVTACRGVGLNANFDAAQGRLFISSKESGEKQKFTIKDGSRTDDSTKSILTSLGLDDIDGTEKPAEEDAQGNIVNTVVVSAASSASITLDGAKLTSDSNTMTVNGLTLNLKEVTEKPVTLSVTTDVDGVYNTIKEFITEYNSILKEMNEAYNAASARKYDVLTSEQKEAMTDEEVEKWEGKIKDSLLRRDTTLNSLISTMRSSMTASVNLDSVTYEYMDLTKKDEKGKPWQYNKPAIYSLSSFGIRTASDYTEGGILHIYGDEEDELYASEENKLKKALEENPEIVQNVFNKLCTDLYDTLTKKMASSSISSALTFYNDKELKSQISTYEDDLKTLQEKLNEQEDRYYKQFTAMEKAMSASQTQSSSLAGMLGG